MVTVISVAVETVIYDALEMEIYDVAEREIFVAMEMGNAVAVEMVSFAALVTHFLCDVSPTTLIQTCFDHGVTSTSVGILI